MIPLKQFLLYSLLAATWTVSAKPTRQHAHERPSKKVRTVVTTDVEQDDLTSLVRYLLYLPDLDTQGIIYSSSRFHWQGDYKGTTFFLPGREYDTPQTSFRWVGNTTIEDTVLAAYAQVYPNFKVHDPGYPDPDELLSLVKIGNVDFEGEMAYDTAGSDLIKSLILDNDQRPLFLQAWGGTNTIARALKSIEEDNSASTTWSQRKSQISAKAIIMASGFQDKTYADYISVAWPDLQVRSSGVPWTVYNCNTTGKGNVRGLPSVTGLTENDNIYFTGEWIRNNILIGPLGKLYRSWLDGQHMAGDQIDFFGNTTAFPIPDDLWCPPLGKNDFLGEGDDGTYFPLLHSGIEDPENPNFGGWGGRAEKNVSVTANLWESVVNETAPNGTLVSGYGTNRFISAMQNDMAARIHWTMTADYGASNHPPSVKIIHNRRCSAVPGASITLSAVTKDPDSDEVALEWWQYVEEGTYNGTVSITQSNGGRAIVQIPLEAKAGETISIIVEGTDSGSPPLTRYDRAIIEIE